MNFWINGFIGGMLYLPASAFAELWGIPYLVSRGFSHTGAATALSMVFVGWVVGGPIYGWISDRICRRRLPVFVGCIGSASIITALLLMPHLSKPTAYIMLFSFGFISSAQIIAFAIGREAGDAHLSGTAIALTNMLVMLCGAIYQPLIGHLVAWFSSGQVLNGVPVYTYDNYAFALTAIPIGIFIAAFMCFFLKETYGQSNDFKHHIK